MVCEYCHRDETLAAGCEPRPHTVGRRQYAPVAFGDEARFQTVGWALRRFPGNLPVLGLRLALWVLYIQVRGSPRESYAPTDRCHDCLAAVGGFHHPDCDVEACPVDGLQALICGRCPERA